MIRLKSLLLESYDHGRVLLEFTIEFIDGINDILSKVSNHKLVLVRMNETSDWNRDNIGLGGSDNYKYKVTSTSKELNEILNNGENNARAKYLGFSIDSTIDTSFNDDSKDLKKISFNQQKNVLNNIYGDLINRLKLIDIPTNCSNNTINTDQFIDPTKNCISSDIRFGYKDISPDQNFAREEEKLFEKTIINQIQSYAWNMLQTTLITRMKNINKDVGYFDTNIE